MKNWETITYQTIRNASLQNNMLEVEFNNDDKVKIDINSLLPFVDEGVVKLLNRGSVQHSAYEVNFKLDDEKDISIPWDKIRVLTDKEFGRFMAEKAEEQAKLIGIKLKRLREKKGIRSNELAERSGITPQTITRIEKGHTDVGFSTLRKLLASMGYTLKDLANQELELEAEKQPEKSYQFLLKKLMKAGVDSQLLLKKIIPEGIQNALTSTKNQQPDLLLDEAAAYVSTVFNWSIEDVWSNRELAVQPNAASEALYKMPANANVNQIKAYAHYGYYLVNVVKKACNKIENIEYPGDTEEFKQTLLSEYGNISLESILRYSWDMGIIVLPLNDSGLFHGASWNIGGRHAVIVKQNTNSHSRWIFDLLHELYHVFYHLQKSNTSIVETSEISPFSNDAPQEEREANSFANLVLFDGKAEEYAQESVSIANWNLAKLSKAVQQVAELNQVRTDSLANYLAFRLNFQGQNWWGQASQLQETTPNPYSVAIDILKEKISINKLNPIEANLLKMAMNT